MKAIHYCGEGIRYMLPGWPVCGTGDFAYKTRENGNQSYSPTLVTCKKCLKLLKEANLTTPA